MKNNYGDQLNALFERYESAFEDYEAGLLSEIKRKQEEIAEYKAFMLGLQLSSEDEVRLLRLLGKHKDSSGTETDK